MILHHGCFHIRKSADRSLFAAPRGLSQLVTSFIGSWCQGIHLMLLLAWTSCSIFRSILVLTFFELLEFLKHWLFRSKKAFILFALSTFRWNCFYPWLERPISRRVNFIRHDLSLCPLYLFFLLFFALFDFQWPQNRLGFVPNLCWVVGTSGLEPPTSRLSGARSNLLSYAPIVFWVTIVWRSLKIEQQQTFLRCAN